jgi:chromosome segregation ATPase
MKYLRTYNEMIQVEDDDTKQMISAKERLNNFDKTVKEYNQKKQQLSTLINNKDGDIEDDIDKIIGKGSDRNQLLSKYLTILNIQKSLLKQQDRITYYTGMKKQRLENKSDAMKLKNPEEKKQQLDSLNQQIKDIDSKINSMKNEIKEKEKQLTEKEKELNTYIKDTIKEFNDSLKELMKNG